MSKPLLNLCLLSFSGGTLKSLKTTHVPGKSSFHLYTEFILCCVSIAVIATVKIKQVPLKTLNFSDNILFRVNNTLNDKFCLFEFVLIKF